MTGHLLAEGLARTTSGEAVLFWILAPAAIAASLGMVLSRNAVHSALWLVLTMFCLAAFYVVQDAPFLGAVQVVVYAGAIMILFLFVIMLIGVDFSDSLVETLRGQRVTAVLLGVGFAGLLILPIAKAVSRTHAVGLGAAGFNDNVSDIARLLFTRYVWPFEVVSALLIVAAVGAMVLGHREQTDRLTQKQRSQQRFTRAEGPITPLPGPGVYAMHDAVDRPGLLPSGEPARQSVMAEYADTAGVNPLEEKPRHVGVAGESHR